MDCFVAALLAMTRHAKAARPPAPANPLAHRAALPHGARADAARSTSGKSFTSLMLTGIAFKIASTLFFSAMLALVKYYSDYPVSELVFFRSSFALIPLVFWLLSRGDFPRALHTKWLGGHLVRSLAGVGSMSLMFGPYGFLPLADVTAIGYAAPLLIVVFSALLLRETVSLSRWAAVMIGFSGVLVMLWEHIG